MNIGAIIKKNRREKDMTQEQLAEYLNVSVSAVSQWESEKTTPDISAIPLLCNLLGISADTLLGIDIEKRAEIINKIREDADKYSSRGYNDKARIIIMSGLEKYPDDYSLMQDLMYISFWQYNMEKHGDFTYNQQQRDAFFKEAIRLGERILDGCIDDDLRHGAIQILCFCYRDKGDVERAVKLAQSMPPLSCSSESLMSSCQNGTAEYRSLQCEMYNLLQLFEDNLTSMNRRLDNGEFPYSEVEQAFLRDKRIALLELVFENGDFGFYHTRLSDTHYAQAFYYAQNSDKTQTLFHLKKAAYHAVEFIRCRGAVRHTSLVFRGYGQDGIEGGFITECPDNDARRLLNNVKSQDFDFIRSTEEFNEIEALLAQYAGKWQVKE